MRDIHYESAYLVNQSSFYIQRSNKTKSNYIFTAYPESKQNQIKVYFYCIDFVKKTIDAST